MKLIKFDDEYFLLEEAAVTAGDYLYNNDAIINIVRTTETRRGWQVLATTDPYIDLPKIDRAQIEKPAPTTFQQSDLIAYSNWVLTWCSTNKYRKTTDGVKPFANGEEYTDEQLFQMYLDSLKEEKTEWNDIEVEIDGEHVRISNI